MERDWKNLGDQILETVAEAIDSGDFSRLNDMVSGTVNNVVEEVRKQADQKRAAKDDFIRSAQENAANRERWERQQEEIRRRQEERREEWRNRQQQRLQREAAERKEAQIRRETVRQAYVESAERQGDSSYKKRQNGGKIPFERIGSVSNVLYTVFGSFGIGIAILLCMALALDSLFGAGHMGPMAYLTAVLAVASVVMMQIASRQRGLLHRAERYIKFCGKKMYADLEELAGYMGKSLRFVKNDLKKMIKIGMFPQGHLDKQETCVMLTDEVYHQYAEADRAYQAREEMKARENRQLTPEEQKQEMNRQQESKLNALVAEGMSYIEKLRSLNETIPGEEISDRLSQLEGLLRQIFDRVREHPEQMDRMQKLMEYYLPTTVKLVEAYADFEKVESPGQDILGAKEEIYKTLGIINEAFVELLNTLFQDAVFDVTTDAQVLQTMLAREGLRREMNAEPIYSNTVRSEQTASEGNAEAEESLSAGQESSPSAAFHIRGIGEEDPSGAELKAPWEG